MPSHAQGMLNSSQRGIWLGQRLFADKPIFNTGQFVTIGGRLRVDLFLQALPATVAESPGLSLPPGSQPLDCDCPIVDLRHDADPDAAARRWMQDDMTVAMRLNEPIPLRFRLFRVADDRVVWYQKYHHIIIDAIGQKLLCERTAARYRALTAGEPAPALDAATPSDLLAEQYAYAHSLAHARDRAYWLQRLANRPDPLLDLDRHQSAWFGAGRMQRRSISIPDATSAALTARVRGAGGSMLSLLCALCFTLFARLGGREELVFGVTLSHRTTTAKRRMIGLLSDSMPLRLGPDLATPLGQAVRDIWRAIQRDSRHARLPLLELQTALDTARQGQSSLFDVLINYLPVCYDFGFEGPPVTAHNLSYGFTAPWVLTWADTGPGRDAEVALDFDPGLISSGEADRVAAAFGVLVRAAADHSDRSLSALPLMNAEDRAALLGRARAPQCCVPETTIAALCAAQAARTPDAVALVYGGERWSYARLRDAAGRLAGRLAGLGIGAGEAVGIALPRTPELVVAVLAVHKAGAAYLPLDPDYPAERIRLMVEDQRLPLIVTTADLASRFGGLPSRLLLVDRPVPPDEPPAATPQPPAPEDLAYILFTSGSTGRPKAVGVEHRNLVNLVTWGQCVLSRAEQDALLFSTSLNFDLSAFELFVPLCGGGCAILVPNLLALQTDSARHAVRAVNTGPSLIEALLRTSALPAGVTTLILAGECLPRHLADRIFAAAPGVRLLNCYGPTEATVYSTWETVAPNDPDEPSVGRPLWNTTAHVLDAHAGLLPAGAVGELYLGGAGVGRGYLGQPELTAARFLPDRYERGRLYRTGDRARWRDDGRIDVLGRIDDQIKINGLRVEPAEIEEALRRHPTVAEAVVVLRADAVGAARLVAYVVAKPLAEHDEGVLRAALATTLPRHMVPQNYVWLPALPLTPNGKLDRRALPAPRVASAALGPAPATATEAAVAAVWQEVLQAPPPGSSVDFFEAGGDSLALISLFTAIEARFGVHLSADVLRQGLTVAGMAQFLDRASAPLPGAAAGRLVALQADGDRTPFFCVPGAGGSALGLRHLAGHMPKNRPFFGLHRPDDDDLSAHIEDLAAWDIQAIRTVQPHGPYLLVGYSFGAFVAYEMARQLRGAGERVDLLAIIDTGWPGWRLSPSNLLPTVWRMVANLPRLVTDELADVEQRQSAGRGIRLLRRALRELRGLPPDLFDLSRFDASTQSMLRANLAAHYGYRPPPTPTRVPVAVFVATVQHLSILSSDAALGWNAASEGRPKVHSVRGNHFTIIEEPKVSGLAEAMSAALDAVSPEAAPIASLAERSS